MKKYIIKHKQTGKYFNIREHGLDLFNLGLNPKIYTDEIFLKKDIQNFNQLKEKQMIVYSNSEIGLDVHGKPSWYDERHTKKLTEKQKQKLQWYHNAQEMIKKNREFVENLQASDLIVEEWKDT